MARPKKPGGRGKPSRGRAKASTASAATPRTPTSGGTGHYVTYACDPLTDTYPGAPSGLIDALQGVQELAPALARGRILIAISDEDEEE